MKNTKIIILLAVFSILTLTSFAVAQSGDCAATDYQCKVDASTRKLVENPQDFEAYYSRGIAYHALNREADAIADFTIYIASNPADKNFLADGYGNRANAYKNIANYTKALADYNTALDLRVSTFDLNNRGNCYLAMDDKVNALADYTRAISIDSNDAEPYYNRAKVYSAQKQYQKAIDDLDIYVTLDISSKAFLADGYQNRSLAYSNLGSKKQALRDINISIEIDPTVAARFRNRAAIYRTLGEVVLAEADEKAALELEN